MKQHITIVQLNELSDKAKERLREWWNHRIVEDSVREPSIIVGAVKYPKLSIGQMIEFLDEHLKLDETEWSIRFHTGSNKIRYVDLWWHKIGDYYEDELKLCDALWSATKKVLEQ